MDRNHPLALTLFAGVVLALLGIRFLSGGVRETTSPRPCPVVVEVLGDAVRFPGVRLFDGPGVTVHEAIRAAGGAGFSGRGFYDPDSGTGTRRLETGDRIRVDRGREGQPRVTVERMDGKTAVLLGLKLDINRAGADELAALPGMTPEAVAAILRRRESGPIRSFEDLKGLPGLRPRQVDKWKPYIEAKRP